MSEFDTQAGKRVKKLRIEAGLNQQKLADKMGVSRPMLSLLENGGKKITAEELIKISEIFSIPIGVLSGVEKLPEVNLPNEIVSKREHTEIRINVPQKNMKKFKEVLLYILSSIGSKPNIGETVIYKLLYFMDFNFYEIYEEQLIGATYIKNKFGPTPVEFKKIIGKMIEDKEIEKVESKYFNYPQTKYLPLRKPKLSILKADEIELINDVLNKLSNMNAAQISDYSHNDVPWLTTNDCKIIEYESVFYRTPEYSLREYANEV